MFPLPLEIVVDLMVMVRIAGVNSIIALKTGGGKTHTSAYVAKYHFVRAVSMQKVFKGELIIEG